MNQPQNRTLSPQDYNDYSVGEILRCTRISYNLTLEQVEASIRIRLAHLQAIEDNDINKLPGRVYAIGFVRTYAEYLQLDGDRLVQIFKNQSIGTKPKADLHFPAMRRENQLPATPYVLGGLVGAILLIFAWSLFYGHNRVTVDEIPEITIEEASLSEAPPIGIEQTDEQKNEAQIVTVEKPSSILQPEEKTAAVKNRMVINVQQNSWIEIRNAQGRAILSTILKPGDQYLIPEEEGLTLATGNAGGFTILLDGKALPPIGNAAQVKRGVSLNPADLVKNVEN